VIRHPSADPVEAFDGLVTAANDGSAPAPGADAASGSHSSPTTADAGPEHRDGWSRNRLSAAVAAIRGNHARPAGERPLADEIGFFATIGARRDIPHGVALARRGTTTGEVHLVERGAVALVEEHDGRRPIVAFAVRREFCGSVPALLHEPEPWDAVAVMDTSVITVPAARFSAAVQDHWVDRWTTRTLAWLAAVGARMEDIDGRDLDAQAAALLLRHPGEFPVEVCRRAISDLLDIDDAMTRRIVDDLERRGAVRVVGSRISVARPDILRDVVAVGRSGPRRRGSRAVGRRRAVAPTA